jgi:cation transport ATPase
MVQESQFHRILPVLQTALAMFFGGWGLWVRNSILSRPFWGNSTSWDSTLRFHVWPWPLKFAAVLNMPAFLAGGLLSWPLPALQSPGLSETVLYLPVLLFVPLLWYLVGSWLDQMRGAHKNRSAVKGKWMLVIIFGAICAALASIPDSVGGYVSYFPSGIVIWLIAVIGMVRSMVSRKRASRAG